MKIPDHLAKRLLPLLIIGFGPALLAPAQVTAGNLGITMENDFFGSAGTDRYFTNGLNLSYVSDRHPRWLDVLAEVSHWHRNGSAVRRVSIVGGQDIYTPQDIEERNLIEDDRPYAGWLYLGMGVHDRGPLLEEKRGEGSCQWESQDSTEVIVGMVGPQSYAGEVQYWWHENVIGFSNTRKPSGWDNQLDNELAVALLREHKWRIRKLGEQRQGLEVDLIPHLSAAAGTVTTYAAAGAEARLGWSLADDFGSAKHRAGLSPTRIAAPLWGVDRAGQHQKAFAFHLFTKLEGRAVLRDIFLDGNTFADSHSVDRKPFIFSLSSGASLLLWQRAEITYTHVYQSKEFDGQPLAHVYGSVTVSCYW